MFINFKGNTDDLETTLEGLPHVNGFSYPITDKNNRYLVGLSVDGRPEGGLIYCGTLENMHTVVRFLKTFFGHDGKERKCHQS